MGIWALILPNKQLSSVPHTHNLPIAKESISLADWPLPHHSLSIYHWQDNKQITSVPLLGFQVISGYYRVKSYLLLPDKLTYYWSSAVLLFVQFYSLFFLSFSLSTSFSVPLCCCCCCCSAGVCRGVALLVSLVDETKKSPVTVTPPVVVCLDQPRHCCFFPLLSLYLDLPILCSLPYLPPSSSSA